MIEEDENYQFETYGGLHTIYAANKVALRWRSNELTITQPDPRWQRFPTRVFLFPKSRSHYATFLRNLGEEDNQNLRFVRGGLIFDLIRRLLSLIDTFKFDRFFWKVTRDEIQTQELLIRMKCGHSMRRFLTKNGKVKGR